MINLSPGCQHTTATADKGSLLPPAQEENIPPLSRENLLSAGGSEEQSSNQQRRNLRYPISINIEKPNLTGPAKILPLMNPKKCCTSREQNATECPLSP
jgi:hypothetical protein